ncbi:porin [Erythrobacter neustonensis]|uniref:porin n=1 Tax=Erythrobacter neustonensis TaxID=1112 RepID=UPI0009EF69CF|nr:porin [Erythrobacter neustonensis]
MSPRAPIAAIRLVAAGFLLSASLPAIAQGTAPAVGESADGATIADLQRQIDELKALVGALQAQRAAPAAPAPAPALAVSQTPAAAPSPAPLAGPAADAPVTAAQLAAAPAPAKPKAWYEKLRLRGYTQMRFNQIVSGDADAPAGISRLRTIGDGDVRPGNNFSFRRMRLVLQGDINEHVSLYFQPDFAAAVSNQSAGERREGSVSLRDMYADVFPFDDKSFRVRLGQSKVPYGWENMQSSSNRLALDRTDAINSAASGERDLGIVAYYTPARVQAIWKRLEDDGQKLFGNYGAFGFGAFNGQGLNRTEGNDGVMLVGLATWPFELGGIGLDGQVFEIGGSVMHNRIRPEVRTGGLSAASFKDERVNVHAILYPQPIGVQAEWNWGTGPEFVPATGQIEERPLNGGYVQVMGKIDESPLGTIYPFARWQYYRGGFKAAINSPRLETEELELGLEMQIDKALEITATYGFAKRKEADERRTGQAEGQILRLQAQWNY